MATTTNYSWTTPDDTDLVKDGASAIRTLGSAIDTTTKNLNPQTTTGAIAYRSSTSNVNTALAIGTAGQVLTVNSGATAPEWATPTGVSGPSFRAFRNTSQQSFNANTATKIQFNGESYDTDNCFDSTTNYRFTPNKAGYYEINLGVSFSGVNASTTKELTIYKNGSAYSLIFSSAGSGTPGASCTFNGSDLIYFNGTTDYVEGYIYDSDGTARNVLNGESKSYFSGVWIRS